MTRYSALKSDLEDKGWKCHLIPFEVGSRGYISRSNKLNLMNTFLSNRLKPNVFKCVKDMSKISLLCSFSIFHAYTQPTWTDPTFLESWRNCSLFCNTFLLLCSVLYNFCIIYAYDRLWFSPWWCSSKDYVSVLKAVKYVCYIFW